MYSYLHAHNNEAVENIFLLPFVLSLNGPHQSFCIFYPNYYRDVQSSLLLTFSKK